MKSILAATIIALSAGTASAGDYIDQFRFGGTFHNPAFLEGDGNAEKDQFGVTAEVLFNELNLDMRDAPEDDFINMLLTPRIHIGGTYNTADNGTSFIYAGWTYHYDFTDQIFAEASFGGAWNNGSKTSKPDRVGLGSHTTFRESVSLGYKFSDEMDVVLQWEHLSHAGLAGDENRGLTNLSVKLGIDF